MTPEAIVAGGLVARSGTAGIGPATGSTRLLLLSIDAIAVLPAR